MDKIEHLLPLKIKEIDVLEEIKVEDIKDIGILKINDDTLGVSIIIEY